MTTIYLVRHGESAGNANPSANVADWGEFESPLTKKGKRQAEELAKKLEHVHFDAFFSSDYTRATQTAEILRLERTIAVQATKRIRERQYYKEVNRVLAGGKTFEQLKADMTEKLHQLDEAGKMAYKHGDWMESAEESMARLITYLREIALAYQDKTILVVNHGNNMRSLLTHLGFAKFDELPSETISNSGYIILETDGIDFFVKETVGVNKQTGKVRIF